MHFDHLLQSLTLQAGNTPCGRYAPSPTGPQHLGNLRTALLAWLQARLAGGRFVLRMDDLDQPRVRVGSAAQILDDLRWLGLEWDEGPDIGGPGAPYEQSQRERFYQAAFQRLLDLGRLYPCSCSRRDIAEVASAPHAPGAVLRYPGTCRPREPLRIAPSEGESLQPAAWRFLLQGERIRVTDYLAGELVQDLAAEIGDFVIRRRGGLFAYQLATAVDDALMGVTDVVRGLDLLDSTPRQMALAAVLDLPTLCYWHVPMMTDEQGERLAKRDGAASLAELRNSGFGPGEVVGLLASSCGLTESGAVLSAGELLNSLDLDQYRQLLQKGSDSSS